MSIPSYMICDTQSFTLFSKYGGCIVTYTHLNQHVPKLKLEPLNKSFMRCNFCILKVDSHNQGA